MSTSLRRTVACKCNEVKIELTGSPILASVCHCDDCQRGSAQLELLLGAPKILDRWGGTPYVLYRKDRIRLLQGREQLVEHRIEEEKNTKRIVASCCNSPVLLDFEPGHWVSIYQQRFETPIPPARIRVQTRFVPSGDVPDDGLPQHQGFPFSMIARLLAAWIAMGFKRPNLSL